MTQPVKDNNRNQITKVILDLSKHKEESNWLTHALNQIIDLKKTPGDTEPLTRNDVLLMIANEASLSGKQPYEVIKVWQERYTSNPSESKE